MPVALGNDANVAALGEAWMGGAKHIKDVVMVTLGTGVGGGIITDGKIVPGKHGLGGEIGHMHVRESETEKCNCGGKGCLEQISSATGIVREAKKLLAKKKDTSRLALIEDLTAKDVLDAAKAGDEDAIEILTETDINLMSEINKRIEEEDLYSLVESSFMPTGVECDQYAILGEIISLRMKSNVYTHENVLDLKLQCNDTIFHVCMNEKDLLGVPAIGRRFKGTVWMQGEMEFLEENK